MKTSPRLLCTLCGRRKITMEQVLPTVGRQICHANIYLICLKHSKQNESAPTRYHGGNCVVCFSKPTPSLATTAWPTLAQSSLFVFVGAIFTPCAAYSIGIAQRWSPPLSKTFPQYLLSNRITLGICM